MKRLARLNRRNVLMSMFSVGETVGRTGIVPVPPIARSLYLDFVPDILNCRTRYQGVGKWHGHVCVRRVVVCLHCPCSVALSHLYFHLARDNLSPYIFYILLCKCLPKCIVYATFMYLNCKSYLLGSSPS